MCLFDCLCVCVSQAVLVDMEEGVVGEVLRGPLGEIFDHQKLITDVSGSGNNWWVCGLQRREGMENW